MLAEYEALLLGPVVSESRKVLRDKSWMRKALPVLSVLPAEAAGARCVECI